MSSEKKQILFKIASEINIGRETIVGYLNAKGYDIENKPTATLTSEMVGLVYDKFKKELRAAEVQREKIEKVKEQRKSYKEHEHDSDEILHSTDTHLNPKTVHNVHKDDIPAQEKKAEQSIPEVGVQSQKEIEKVKAVKPEVAGIGDIIDLNIFKEPIQKKVPRVEKQPIGAKDEKQAPKESTPRPFVNNKKSGEVDDTSSNNRNFKKKINSDVPIQDRGKDKPNFNASQASGQTKLRDMKREPRPDRGDVPPRDQSDRPPREQRPQRDMPPRDQSDRPPREQRPQRDMPPRAQGDRPPREQRPQRDMPPRAQGDRPPRERIEGRFDRDNQNRGDRNAQNTNRPAPRTPGAPPPRDRNESRPPYEGNRRFSGESREKQQTPTNVNVYERPKLKGLTVLGKIDIRPEINFEIDDINKKPNTKRHRDKNDKDPLKITFKDSTKVISSKEELDLQAKKRVKKKHTKEINIEEETRKVAVTLDKNKKKKKRKSIREMISQEDVEKAVRETMHDMDNTAVNARQKLRSKRKAEKDEKFQKEMLEQQEEDNILQLTEFVTTSDLAGLMNINTNDIILKCMELGLMVSINQRLDKDTITLIADDYGFEVEFVDGKQAQFMDLEDDDDENLEWRPPIVTIMGHVDHGKTSLLDFIRKANVVAGEAGGITQHIGAYTVSTADNRSITFLDTPGHEAFTAMRARGAQVTDIVVLIVAADDSVMPQTIEAISHSKAAGVPMVVAINKIDKVDSNPDRIKQQLTEFDILVEEWGGKYQCASISAKKGLNIDTLLDKILIEAELLELKANPDRYARGVVIESNMSKGLGPVATVMVQKGTLKVGDAFVSGTRFGKVRGLIDDKGIRVQKAGPSQPVVVVGYDGMAEAGDSFSAMANESEARKIATQRAQLKREQEMRQVHHITLDEISAQIQIGGVQDLNLIIKADVAGSAEALSDSLYKLSTPEVRVNILHKGVGAVTETDVILASASKAVILAFNINPNVSARKIAEREHVDIRQYNIIYDCINEIQLALEGLLTPEYVEQVTAVVEIRETFKISKKGTIAGCMVLNGKIKRNDKIRILRDGFKIYESTIYSLKREKDDAREVDKNFECGIQVDGFNDIKEGDIIEAFVMIEKKRTLS